MIKLNKDMIIWEDLLVPKILCEHQKKKLILEYFDSKVVYKKFAESKDIHPSILAKWIKLYRENGIEGLKSKTGKFGIGKENFKRTEIEKLKEDS